MDLTEQPTIVAWPTTHYLFVEKIGPFAQTAQRAWTELHRHLPELTSDIEITGYISLYKMPDIYRAGVSISACAEDISSKFQL